MTRNRKLLIAATVFGIVVLVAVCLPSFIPDRETANVKATMKNLQEPSDQTGTNKVSQSATNSGELK